MKHIRRLLMIGVVAFVASAPTTLGLTLTRVFGDHTVLQAASTRLP